MRILDKYILKNVFSSYVFILLVFVGLHFIIDLFSLLSDILKNKPPIFVLSNYYLNMLPLIFLRVSPFSLLMGTLYTFGEMNKNNEIVSMRASGISITRIVLPVIFISLLISSLSFFVQEKILIYSQRKVEEIKEKYIKKSFPQKIERNFAFRSKNKIFFVKSFNPKSNVLEEVIIFEEDENQDIVKKYICQRIIYQDKEWWAKNIIEYKLNSEGDIKEGPLSWEERKIDLEETPKKISLKKSKFFEFISLKELKKEIKRLKKIKASSLLFSLIIDYHKKIVLPLTHFFLVIGVLGFALEIRKRRVALSSLGIGFLVSFFYYCLFSFSVALGKAGVILPYLASWVSALFFFTVGISALLLIK
jgi:lipopolysaccharide export system permease protein